MSEREPIGLALRDMDRAAGRALRRSVLKGTEMSETREDIHGPAFACAAENGHQPGMSIRTYIATAAMQGLLASGPHDCDQHGIAHDAILYADALISALAARKEK